jgi:hypothetical protein
VRALGRHTGLPATSIVWALALASSWSSLVKSTMASILLAICEQRHKIHLGPCTGFLSTVIQIAAGALLYKKRNLLFIRRGLVQLIGCMGQLFGQIKKFAATQYGVCKSWPTVIEPLP